ncbi:NACHT, LRR and PYD domains-containing protein 3 isoform X2 [Platichthys flesus]|uniref:NACHT, LRR and PYD domains-containing protein 3 isoform X2 n=1 Tax=Platichthys flesus TaxID=8260 RepID=UPI002DB8A6CC|nr:NACHT, LRR and PYD domains-containing protein 3 isoform X2 [Platichthys flesus]
MDKEAVLTHVLMQRRTPSLLGGEQPVSVLSSSRYVSQRTDREVEDQLASLDHTILSALSSEVKTVLLVGGEGSGKTTALEKLVVAWAKGEHLQNFTCVLYFGLREIRSLKDELSLETLLQHHHSPVPSESTQLVLQKPEDVLFVFDDLDQYKLSLDASVHTLCSDPRQAVSLSCLISSLLHGSLLRGAAFVVTTRPTGHLKFLSGTRVKVPGFSKLQRETYFKGFFTDPAAANKALLHMERTLGFYDFCTSPRFCWTVCSIYKTLMDAGARLPDTLTQLYVDILVHLMQALSLKEACNRELVQALGVMASHCSASQNSSCTKEELHSFGFQKILCSVGAFLHVDGDLESDACVFSFTSPLMQEFLLAVSFFLDTSASEGVAKMLEKYKGHAKFLDLFLSGLSEPDQHRPLEILLGGFNSDRILDFKSWFKSSSEETLKGCYKDRHHRCFHLLHQAQNLSLVKEIISPSERRGISYGDLSLQDCVALNYVWSCLGEMKLLNLYSTRDLTEEKAEVLAPAMSLSHKIQLSNSTLSTGAVSHLASALSRGRTEELDLNHTSLAGEKFKVLCAGLRDCKLHTLTLLGCELTEASCEDLMSVLTSGSSQLRVLDMMFNQIGDLGFTKLCKALHSPQCSLQQLQLRSCELTAVSMEPLSAALCSGTSELRKVDLTTNTIGDGGVEALCKSLQHPHCKLQSLNLIDTELTGVCCPHLRETLMSEHCSLLELDLSVNDLGQEGALLLCQALSRPGCPVEKLGLTRCELTQRVFKELGSFLRSGTSLLKSLKVGLNKVGDQGVKHLWDAVAHPGCLLEELDVEMTDLTDACVEDLCAAVRASKTLKTLELRNNSLTDASVPALVQVMEDSCNMQEMNLKYNDFSEDVFEMMEECGRIRY